MPLPKPKSSETEDQFISRCMDSEAMKDDYPDQDQRLAVCFSQWRKHQGESKSAGHERRLLSRETAEIRVESQDDGARRLVGKAVPYGTWSDEHFGFGGTFRERIEHGAFDLERDIVVTVEHQNALLLGRTASGTAQIEERDDGVYYTVDLPDTTAGRDVAALVERGDYTGNSFEFISTDDRWDGEDRTVSRGVLFQVGPVASPFYDTDTSVALRSKASSVEIREKNEADLFPVLLDIAEASVLALESREGGGDSLKPHEGETAPRRGTEPEG